MKQLIYVIFCICTYTCFAQQTYSPKYISLQLENDLVDKTDYYFTSGLSLSFAHPFFKKNAFNKLIPSLPHAAMQVYGIHISQDIYTPADVDTASYLPTDRPYVGNLILYMQKVSFIPFKHLRLNSNLGFGFIGNIALGDQTQNGFHSLINNNNSAGWYHQLDNKLLINYSFLLEKGLHVQKNNQFIGILESEIGNLRTNIGFGYLWRVGMLAPYFESYSYKKGQKAFYFSVFMDVKLKFVFYDVTIKESNQELMNPSYSLSPFVFRSRGGITCMYKRFNASFIQNFLSPEFSTGIFHRYASMEIGYRF